MTRLARLFLTDEKGAMAVFFAAALPVLVLFSGVAIDYATLARSKSRVQAITDAAALAANNAKVTTNEQALRVVTSFVKGQVSPDLRIDDEPAIAVSLADSGRTTNVVLTTNFRTRLLSSFRPLVPYQTSATVKRGLDNTVELALVLDTTNSMTTDNKIGTLKVAANNLVDILMKDSSNQVSIAVVPFAQYVNVGTAYRNASWLTRSDDYSVTGAPVCSPQKTTCATYTPTQVCQTSVKSNCRDVTTTTYNDGVPTTKTTQQCDTTCTKYTTQNTCTTWNYADQCNSPVSTYKWTGCVGSRSYPLNLNDDQPATKWPALYNNTTCSTELLPLSTDKTTIKAKISGLVPSGETYMPAGLVWGLHALSRTDPLSTAQPYDAQNRKPRKALVFMTDGMNTKSMSSTTSTTHTGTNTTLANTYTSQLCTNVKAKGIEVYTISLMVTDTTAMQMLRNCATDTEHSFDATDANALKSVFEAIAFSLQRPYLAN
jgi:Flp pilus assembly protein TadG